ncbi:MAG: hypothetical protein H7833_15525 [Magnetococcus sp. DMHC-1]|nr:hypothetical protein [Magnetococcales bacterium]
MNTTIPEIFSSAFLNPGKASKTAFPNPGRPLPDMNPSEISAQQRKQNGLPESGKAFA